LIAFAFAVETLPAIRPFVAAIARPSIWGSFNCPRAHAQKKQ
jgi:hypothetical protein